jgi:acyl-CoA reductase-like NAD-dependent aldehyde dehydrogenase
MADSGSDYSARAAILRRLAAELRSEEERLALLAVAEEYEAESERLRSASGGG